MSNQSSKAASSNPFSSPKKKAEPVTEGNNRIREVITVTPPPKTIEVPEETIEVAEREILPPLTMEEKSCRCCQYFAFEEKLKRSETHQGECRRNAPRPGQGARACWPVVPWKGWCGEFENGVSHEDMVRMARDIGESMSREKF